MLIRGTSRLSPFIQAAMMPLPWAVRRRALNLLFGFSIAPDARIGWSLVLVKRLVMAPRASIGHLNLIRNLELLHMDPGAKIMSRNQIAGHIGGELFLEPDRVSELVLGVETIITHNHIFDCANSVHIGDFTFMAGHRSQISTHDINVKTFKLCTAPVRIGRHCYIGTSSIILKESTLPDCCVLGAGSVYRGYDAEPHSFWAGVPARKVRALPTDSVYFTRA